MCPISNSTGSIIILETSGEDGNITKAFTEYDDLKSLIKKANTVSFIKIFKLYKLRFDLTNKKAVCPFPHHKGGRENSASFYFYPETNTFWCFGCKTGTKPCDFVAAIDKINIYSAAKKIVDLFPLNNEIVEDLTSTQDNYNEIIKIMMDFSNAVRDFRQVNKDSKSISFIEEICKAYDKINLKHELSYEALKSLVEQLKEEINSYIPCEI